jgi:ribonuclease VapC
VIVVDGSALIAILRREPEADRFLRVIAAADRCLLSAVSFLETSMVLAGHSGSASAWIELDTLVAQAGIDVVPQDAALTEAARAAFLRYGKGRHSASLNLGDCAVYALASSRNLALLFKGNDFAQTDVAVAT